MTAFSSVIKKVLLSNRAISRIKNVFFHAIPVFSFFMLLMSGCASPGHIKDIQVSGPTDSQQAPGNTGDTPSTETESNDHIKPEKHIKEDYTSGGAAVMPEKQRYSHPSYPRPSEKTSPA
ncbi:MAG: hypothetical protein PVG39_09515, partial [Desulfobacteraceae bacterium]